MVRFMKPSTTCVHCGQIFKLATGLERHLLRRRRANDGRCAGTKNVASECQICGKVLACKKSLGKHLKRHAYKGEKRTENEEVLPSVKVEETSELETAMESTPIATADAAGDSEMESHPLLSCRRCVEFETYDRFTMIAHTASHLNMTPVIASIRRCVDGAQKRKATRERFCVDCPYSTPNKRSLTVHMKEEKHGRYSGKGRRSMMTATERLTLNQGIIERYRRLADIQKLV